LRFLLSFPLPGIIAFRMIKFALALLVLTAGFSACGKIDNATNANYSQPNALSLNDQRSSWLVGDWQGRGDSSQTFKLSIKSDNSFAQEIENQVGSDGDTIVPYPTQCHYQRSGSVSVATTSSDDVAYFKRYGKKTVPEITISLTTQKFELIADPSNSSNCQAFIDRSNQQPTQDDMLIKRNGKSHFTDAWSEFEYRKQ